MEGFAETQRVDSRGEPILYEAICQTEEYARYLRKLFTCGLIGILVALWILIIPLLLLPVILYLCKPRIQSGSQEAVKYWRLYVTDKNIYYSFYSRPNGTTVVIPLTDIKAITVNDPCGDCSECCRGCSCCCASCTPDYVNIIRIRMKFGKYARYVDRYGYTSNVQIPGAANAESFAEAVLGEMARLGNPQHKYSTQNI